MDSEELKVLIRDEGLSDDERILLARDLASSHSKENTDFLGELANGSDNFLRRAAIEGLGSLRYLPTFSILERIVYDKIFSHLTDNNEEIRRCAILALGEFGNSRSLFPLVNIYLGGNSQTRNSVLHALSGLQDPRSKKFLESIDNENSDFARLIYDSIDPNATHYYSFNGAQEMYEDSILMKGQIKINSPRDLELVKDFLKKSNDDFTSKPQTYVITPKKEFVIGGNLHEHVHVTKGDAVITAGEVRFENENGSWGITNINNRSNGYHPGSSYKDVKNALRKAKISCPDSFTEVFPKDGYFTEEFLSLQPLADYQD